MNDLYEYISDPETVYFEPYDPKNMDETRQDLAWRISSEEMIAVEYDGKLIGNLYLGVRDMETRELGYVFNRAYWKRGFAREACFALMDEAFRTGIHRIFAECDPQNPNSWHLLEALGMRREAYMRKNVFFRRDASGNPIWKDTYVYAILQEEWQESVKGEKNREKAVLPYHF